MDVVAMADELLDRLAEQVIEARTAFPDDDYAGRIYRCASCRGLHGCCAPLDDLVDDYPCPECGRAQEPLTDPGVPFSQKRMLFEHAPGCANAPRGNREERRRARRR